MDGLKIVGIDEKGYGKIYKIVMRDPTIPLTAKAIYAYFCSYAGAGSTIFPSREKIMRDLHLAKNTFTKYLNCLIEAKYIVRHRTATGNVYEILTTVKRKDGKTVEIKSQGYGTIPKFAMLDDRLTVTAKAIYAYLCSYAGSGNSAYPKRSTLLYELDISKAKYYPSYTALVELGYITPIQNTDRKGQFATSTYILNEVLGIDPRIDPDEIRKSASSSRKKEPCRKNQDTVENPGSTDFSTAMSQELGHGKRAMSQKSGHGTMSQKTVHGKLRHTINNNNLHNKQSISSIEDIDDREITNSRTSAEDGHGNLLTSKQESRQLIDYDFLARESEAWVSFKGMFGHFKSPEEEAAYLAICREIINELAHQIELLLNGKSVFVKYNGVSYNRADLLTAIRSASPDMDELCEMVFKIADRRSEIRSLPAYTKKIIMNLWANMN